MKLPIIRDVLRGTTSTAREHDRASATEPGVLTRRGLLRTTWAAAAVAVVANAGASVPLLRKVSVFAVNVEERPDGHNRTAETAAAAKVSGHGDLGRLPPGSRVRRTLECG